VTNGQFPLRLGGNVGQRLRIESSPDLANWTLHTNVTMPGALGNFTVTATNAPLRFYRAALAP
jgi:hypothetical protein